MPIYLKKSTPKKPGDFLNEERGAAAIVMALLTPILIGGLAFGAEIGFWELEKRKLQNAADTAAHAAGTQVRSGEYDDADLKLVAKRIAMVAGYDGSDTRIALQQPPTSGAYAGNNMAVHVTLGHVIPRRFSAIYNPDPVTFTVASTSLVSNGRPACVLALAPSASDAVSVAGSTTVTLDGCDVAANSIASDAVTQQGAGELETDCISTVGETDFGNPSNVTLNDCPAPIENGPLTADPYAFVPEPAVPAACASNAEMNQFTKNSGTGNPKATTNPAFGKRYCGTGNVHIKANINLDAGVYVLSGGNWRVNAGASLSGSDVTLFLTNGATIDINGGASVDLSAPISGTYSGLVIFFDRDDAGSSVINGGANFSLVGAVYGTNTNLTFTGNTTGSLPGECTQIIGYTVAFTGNSDFNTDCSASGTTEIVTAQSIRIVE